jgi:glutaredoxin
MNFSRFLSRSPISSYRIETNQDVKRMPIVKVQGKNNKRRVLLYALSTCVWCKRAKKFLTDNDIEYEYVDVDSCSREEKEKVRNDILSRGARLSYPTIIVDGNSIINGFQVEKIKEVLGI